MESELGRGSRVHRASSAHEPVADSGHGDRHNGCSRRHGSHSSNPTCHAAARGQGGRCCFFAPSAGGTLSEELWKNNNGRPALGTSYEDSSIHTGLVLQSSSGWWGRRHGVSLGYVILQTVFGTLGQASAGKGPRKYRPLYPTRVPLAPVRPVLGLRIHPNKSSGPPLLLVTVPTKGHERP